ncbi:MAG: hypothetical protein R3B41_01925 [Candidatus Doudnabacteria bacterium]
MAQEKKCHKNGAGDHWWIFFFTSNYTTRKAGGYVKELVKSMLWMWQKLEQQQAGQLLYNFSTNPIPTVQEFYETIVDVSQSKHRTFNVPFWLLLSGSYAIGLLEKIIGRGLGINPTRVKKLLRSNYIQPKTLQEMGYQYYFSLRSAMEDWKAQTPKDWQ